MIIIIGLVYYVKIIGATWKFIQNAYIIILKIKKCYKNESSIYVIKTKYCKLGKV